MTPHPLLADGQVQPVTQFDLLAIFQILSHQDRQFSAVARQLRWNLHVFQCGQSLGVVQSGPSDNQRVQRTHCAVQAHQ